MNKLDIDTLSHDKLLEKYKELKDKMDHTKPVMVPTRKVNAGATAIAFFILCNVFFYLPADMMNELGWIVTETLCVAFSIYYYYWLSKPERANKRARKVLVQI